MREIWVATARPDCSPDAVPVWSWWEGESIFFTTKAESRKARNLSRQPRIVLHNGDGVDPIIVKGEAEVVTDKHELERVERAYDDKYVDPHSGAPASIYVEGDKVYRVGPRFVTAWSYATCSSRTDWKFEPAENRWPQNRRRSLRRIEAPPGSPLLF